MSRLLSKLSPFRIHSNWIIWSSYLLGRFTRGTFARFHRPPYLSVEVSAKLLPEGGSIGEVVLFDPAKEELLKVTAKQFQKNMFLPKALELPRDGDISVTLKIVAYL
ncbi:unnamed protein product [Arabis nemorensis]|uniref:Uncharacterized protein n=1 Tax=Arabis nemorensis TaxID=586526 RepID=A0A565B731_9BRAS|nr:unnamed protein product [Arabis nemorensis]